MTSADHVIMYADKLRKQYKGNIETGSTQRLREKDLERIEGRRKSEKRAEGRGPSQLPHLQDAVVAERALQCRRVDVSRDVDGPTELSRQGAPVTHLEAGSIVIVHSS